MNNKQNSIREKPLKQKKVMKRLLPFWFIGVLLVMFFFLGTHQVNGESMEPTFQDQDRILILKRMTPQRNDIVTFTPEDDPSGSYVKRVIGVPGDHLLLRGDPLYLVPKEDEMPEVPADVWEPTNLPASTQIITVESTVATTLFNYSNIPEGHYFVEGDNRNHSTDSRSFGWISQDQIEGVVKYRYYPLSKMGSIS